MLCLGNRITPPSCVCTAGTYDNGVSTLCQTCLVNCLVCTATECTTCVNNRISDVPATGACVCDPNTVPAAVSFAFTTWCTTCADGVINAILDNNYKRI